MEMCSANARKPSWDPVVVCGITVTSPLEREQHGSSDNNDDAYIISFAFSLA